jgi:hypothetical protein
VTVTLDFQTFADALPATVAGGTGFALSGLVDAVSGGRMTEKIAEMFAGKENNRQKRPDYKDRAQAEVVLDAGSFFGLWFLTDRVEALEAYRTPLLIGAGIRLVRGLADAIIAPSEPTGIGAGARRILDLPAIQSRALTNAAKLPADKIMLVRWDYRQKAYIGSDGKPVKYTVPQDGIATSVDGKQLVDADTGRFITHSKGYLGAPMEEWDLALNGPRAGYEYDPGMGSVLEDWSMQPQLPEHTLSSGMDGYEDWSPAYDMSGEGFERGPGSFRSGFDAPF